MNESYSIEIPNEKAGAYRVVAFIIAFINFFAFAYAAFAWDEPSVKELVLFGLGLSFIGLATFVLKKYISGLQKFFPEPLFIICAVIWMLLDAILPGLLLLAFSILSWLVNKKQVIHFDKVGIRYPSFIKKFFLWREVEFVILKDDILTIETRDNRLLQATLDKTVAASLDATMFNEFCKERTLSNSSTA